jgi:hypothetical protein
MKNINPLLVAVVVEAAFRGMEAKVAAVGGTEFLVLL